MTITLPMASANIRAQIQRHSLAETEPEARHDKMVFMDFMGKSWRYGGITRPDIIFNIIYIMRTHIVVAKLLSFLLDKLLVDSASIDSDDGSCGGVFCFG